MIRSSHVILVFIFSVFISDKSSGSPVNSSWKGTKSDGREWLISKLFNEQKYDPMNYPSNNTLELGFTLFSFDINQKKKTLDADAWLLMSWHDPRLEWNPAEFGQEKRLSVDPSKIWKPDLALYNSANSERNFPCRETNVVIEHHGKLTWVNPCHFEARCKDLNLVRYPLEEQNCTLEFGSWTMDGHLLDLQLEARKPEMDLRNYNEAGDWRITGSSAWREAKIYSLSPEPYISIKFQLIFQRRLNEGV